VGRLGIDRKRNHVNRRSFLAAAGSAALSLRATPARKPNVVVILADDMGFSDAGCYGGEIDTPNIDRLAAQGLRFTRMYSTARCGPSRNCLLSGYYAQQTAVDVMTPGNIPSWANFLPEYIKPLGYRSYHSGKWHIKTTPLAGAGFDHSYTMLDELRFFTQNYHELDGRPLPKPKPEEHYYSTTAIAEYGLRFLREHAREHAADPFFLYLAFHAPHFPLQAPPEDIARYRDRFSEGWDTVRERRLARMRRMGFVNCGLAKLEPDIFPGWNVPEAELAQRLGAGEVGRAVPWSTLTKEQKSFQRTKIAIHAAMITRMDTEIGRVVDQLKAMNALDDTAILVLSDNGASAEIMIRGDGHDQAAAPGSAQTHLCIGPGWATAANTPFRLHKSYVHEGGIASPFVMHWPNGIRERGQLRHDQCHFIDVLPTVLDLAGGKSARPTGAPPLAGKSLVPSLRQDNSVKREFLYFNHNKNRALHAGDWKIVAKGETGPWELYDMRTDRCEQNDLALKEPGRLTKLAALWQEQDSLYVKQRESAEPSAKPLMPARA
jgi:arylsulfatase A-like enzyme